MNWRVEDIANFGISQSILRIVQPNIKALMVSPMDVTLRQNNMAVVLSRLPTRWNSEDVWLKQAREAVNRVKSEKGSLVTSVGLSGWDYLTWVAGNLGAKLLVILPPTTADIVATYAEQICNDLDIKMELTTIVAPIPNGKLRREEAFRIRDLLVTGLSDRFIPIVIRSGGYWEKVVANAEKVDDEFRVDYPKAIISADWTKHSMSECGMSFEWQEHLIHLTRGVYGPWRGEMSSDYFTALTQEKSGNPRDELATLTYILNSAILRGSGSIIRGGDPVLSFSSHDPYQLMALNRYNPRLRGDSFQPFGVAVRTETLQRLGIRPVIYGTETEYRSLSEIDRPYFQSRGRSNSVDPNNDWSRENESRLFGDLDLDSIKADVVAIVPTKAIAIELQKRSGYKVVHLFD